MSKKFRQTQTPKVVPIATLLAVDKEGNVLGFWETIYDLKQPLKTYLDSSAQALVAWSDATSGASFKEKSDK